MGMDSLVLGSCLLHNWLDVFFFSLGSSAAYRGFRWASVSRWLVRFFRCFVLFFLVLFFFLVFIRCGRSSSPGPKMAAALNGIDGWSNSQSQKSQKSPKKKRNEKKKRNRPWSWWIGALINRRRSIDRTAKGRAVAGGADRHQTFLCFFCFF